MALRCFCDPPDDADADLFRQVSCPVPIVEQGRRIAQARAGVGDEQLGADDTWTVG